MRIKSDEERQINQTIGKTLRSIRRGHNMSMQDMAEMLDVSYQQLQKYENGTNRISAAKLFYLMGKMCEF